MRKNDTFSDGATASSPNAVICLIKPGRPRLDYCPAPGTRSICIRIPGVAEVQLYKILGVILYDMVDLVR
ncbi:hypothetical protein GEV33_008075 [Tenebrio molitor]|uniref:Uncharacterized protein n=1 Tax=Tenebrio molitor TaxID=7067 RepID=A0A8J6LB74_TENMO|nr:hypothetical protein GEV33_008075 [Tenebrio molitor]